MIEEGREVPVVGEHVERREGVFYVAGTRISLDSVVYAFREGCSPESIREDFEGLTLAHVCGAIAFYLDRQEAIDAYLIGRKAQWAELERGGCPPDDARGLSRRGSIEASRLPPHEDSVSRG